MTPAVVVAQKAGVSIGLHEYEHDPAASSFGEEAAEKLGVSAKTIFKTLVVESGNKKLAVAIIPVLESLNLKLVAKAIGEKKTEMAEGKLVERSTGYVLGGVSPLGQRKLLPTVIDSSAQAYEQIYVSGGRRGFDISIAPSDLAALTGAKFAALTRN